MSCMSMSIKFAAASNGIFFSELVTYEVNWIWWSPCPSPMGSPKEIAKREIVSFFVG
jgi:hypothetical protein